METELCVSGLADLISIIVVTWNTCELTRKCLESVYATMPPLTFEVFVVDNDSTDDTPKMVAAQFPQATLINSGGNLGFARANNLALSRAIGQYVMLLNPDTELRSNAVQRMLEFLKEHPDTAVVGPKLIGSDGELQKNGRSYPTVLRELMGLLQLGRRFPRKFDEMQFGRENFDVIAEVDEVMGACMLIRRTAIDEVGLMDERYFMYYEEVDWCYRMKKRGWKIFYLPTAEVVHHGGKSSEQIGLNKLRIAFNSMYLYFRKNKSLPSAVFLRIVSWLLLCYADLPFVRRRRQRKG